MAAKPIPSPEKPAKSPAPGARLALALLLAINLFNYIDRQVLAAVEPNIRRDLLSDDPQAKTKMGLLSTAFLVSYMIFAPVFGWLADRMSRWKLVAIGVLLWSLASGASGVDWHQNVVTAYWILLLTRCFVGIGEGGYGPVAPTVLSDLYPEKIRGRIMSLFYLAIPVGGALGYTLGGQLAGMANWGWRWAFFIVVPPGILLGIWSYFMPDPPRGQVDLAGAAPPRRAELKDYFSLLKIPSYVLNTLGMAAMTFAIGGFAYWMPAFLGLHKVADLQVPGIGAIRAVTLFGAITALSGLIATLLGGIIGDALRSRFPGSYFLVSGTAMIVGFPILLGVVFVPYPWGWIFVFLGVSCLFFNTGPTNTILANVTHPSVRATGFALNILIIHALGDAISPTVIGFVADLRLRGDEAADLDLGFILISVTTLIGGIIWLCGARYLGRDTELAPTRLNADLNG